MLNDDDLHDDDLDDDSLDDEFDDHICETLTQIDFNQDLLLVIKKDGDLVVVIPFDEKLSVHQHRQFEKIGVALDSSWILSLFLWIELQFKYFTLHFKDLLDKYNNQD